MHYCPVFPGTWRLSLCSETLYCICICQLVTDHHFVLQGHGWDGHHTPPVVCLCVRWRIYFTLLFPYLIFLFINCFLWSFLQYFFHNKHASAYMLVYSFYLLLLLLFFWEFLSCNWISSDASTIQFSCNIIIICYVRVVLSCCYTCSSLFQ